MADENFKKEFLFTHNSFRKQHNTPPLTLSAEMCASAQKWADQLVLMQRMQHSETEHGENIYFAWSSEPKQLTGKEAVESWYSEIKDYNWASPGFAGNTGHFTQVVWKETSMVGVGLATDGKNIYVVGQYSPAGNMNMPGYFEKNVLPNAGGEPGDAGKTSGGGRGKNTSCSLL